MSGLPKSKPFSECQSENDGSSVANGNPIASAGRCISALPSRATEDGVGSDSPPDDVRLAYMDLIAILKGRTAIRCPTHLPDAGVTLHALDSEARVEALLGLFQIGDELLESSQECSLLLGS
jgi:hypothetical protein